MAQRLVTIFGGAGFVGTTLVEHLAKSGGRIRVAVRRPNSAMHVKPLGDVGQIQVVQANLRDENSVRAAIQGSDAVINLVGILSQSGAQKFNDIHVKGAETVARICAELGIETLVHMSALGADEQSEALYAISKARGEKAIKRVFPEATIIRPSVIFGTGDGLFNRFAQAASLPILPVFSGDTKFQPVYVGDVAEVMIKAMADKAMQGETYELGGADIYSLRDMMKLAAREAMRKVWFVDMPDFIAPYQVFFLGLLPNPPITLDQLKMLKTDNVVHADALGLPDLGISPTLLGAVLPNYLHQYRPKGQFAENVTG
ncbi:NAD-dependent epimerase/dehydratase [hydrothermal vent metagenome]|uniref:NAD-dependent epimerase/dehydratase n=1 Tax=hydrothermal vent metagenome TaxID=652676 RepID=A0A3B1AT60_9ZZZZ